MAKKIEDLLEQHSNLEAAVHVLLEGCMGSSMGHKALAKWDDVLTCEQESQHTVVTIPGEVADQSLVEWLNESLESVGSTLFFAPNPIVPDSFVLVAKRVPHEV